jgi:hypothetical protein
MAKYIVHGQELKVYRQVRNFALEIEADDVIEAHAAAHSAWDMERIDLWAKIVDEQPAQLTEIAANVFFGVPRKIGVEE